MLTYSIVTSKIQEKITQYTNKAASGVPDALFFKNLADKLQTALDTLTAVGEANATQQDLIVAWQTYSETVQKRYLKICSTNGWYILGGVFLLGAITNNIYHRIRNK
jgi:hypothetical protein